MNRKIKILHLEDSFKDSELIQSLIESGEIEQKLTTERQQAEEELKITNRELVYQIEEKEIRQAELMVMNEVLFCQNKEKEKLTIELIAAKEKAEESDRLKSSFLANMSHEIRTPLNGILGFTELLKEPELSYKQQEYYISIIEKSGARLLNIINDIMCISRIESGQMEISISEINVNEQMDEIFSFFKPEAEQKGIQISCKNNLRLNETFMNTDKDKFLAILTNLVKNAIKFTKKGSIEFGFNLTCSPAVAVGSVLDKTCPVPTIESIEFFVKDTGIGIRPEQLEFVFERFRQASGSVNIRFEGAGLGLSISKAFVEILGGTIRIESEFGKGSDIYFTLPTMNFKEVKSDSKSIVWNETIKREINL